MKKTLLIGALALTAPAMAQTLTATTLNNQWKKTVNIDNSTQLILFAGDMDGSDVIRDSLTALNISDLGKRNWIYVADISSMPPMITSMFALPKMKKFAFSIALDIEGDVTKNWMKKEEQATVFELNKLTIENTYYFSDKAKLVAFLIEKQAVKSRADAIETTTTIAEKTPENDINTDEKTITFTNETPQTAE